MVAVALSCLVFYDKPARPVPITTLAIGFISLLGILFLFIILTFRRIKLAVALIAEGSRWVEIVIWIRWAQMKCLLVQKWNGWVFTVRSLAALEQSETFRNSLEQENIQNWCVFIIGTFHLSPNNTFHYDLREQISNMWIFIVFYDLLCR